MNFSQSSDALSLFIESIVAKTIDAAIRDGRLQPAQARQKGAEKSVLTAREVAERYSVSVSTLADWRWRSKGPAWTKPGRSVLYRLVDCEEYFRIQRVRTRESDRLAGLSR